jgi:hypothetical protein
MDEHGELKSVGQLIVQVCFPRHLVVMIFDTLAAQPGKREIVPKSQLDIDNKPKNA